MSEDFGWVDVFGALLMGIAIGFLIGLFIVGKHESDFDKFCPECGHYYKTEEYCSYDGSELKMIGEEE